MKIKVGTILLFFSILVLISGISYSFSVTFQWDESLDPGMKEGGYYGLILSQEIPDKNFPFYSSIMEGEKRFWESEESKWVIQEEASGLMPNTSYFITVVCVQGNDMKSEMSNIINFKKIEASELGEEYFFQTPLEKYLSVIFGTVEEVADLNWGLGGIVLSSSGKIDFKFEAFSAHSAPIEIFVRDKLSGLVISNRISKTIGSEAAEMNGEVSYFMASANAELVITCGFVATTYYFGRISVSIKNNIEEKGLIKFSRMIKNEFTSKEVTNRELLRVAISSLKILAGGRTNISPGDVNGDGRVGMEETLWALRSLSILE